MSKIFKILGILVLLFTAIVLAGVIVFNRMYPPERIRKIIMEQVSQKLKREITLGDVRIGIFQGIALNNFALSEFPGFKNGTFIKTDRLILKFQWLPLLQKKVVIDEIRLDAPEVMIIRTADGKTTNFSDLTASSTMTAATPEQSGKTSLSAVTLTVTKASISNGKATFIDLSPKKTKITLDPINLSVSGTGMNKPMLIEAAIGVNASFGGKSPAIRGSIKTKSIAELQAQKVQMDFLEWKMRGLALTVKGNVENFSKPDLDLNAEIRDLDLAALTGPGNPLGVSGLLPKELTISGSPQLAFTCKGDLENLALSSRLNLMTTSIYYSSFFRKDRDTAFSIEFNGRIKNQSDLSINDLKLRLSAMELALSGELHHLKSDYPVLKLNLNIPSFDFSEVAKCSPFAVPYSPSGQVSLQASVNGTLKSPQVKADCSLDKAGARIQTLTLHALSGKISYADDDLEVPQLAGELTSKDKPASQFGLQASVKNFKAPEISLNANFNQLDLGMFLTESQKGETGKKENPEGKKKEPPPPYKGPEITVRGSLSIGKVLYSKFQGEKAQATWNLTGITPLLNKISGKARFGMGNGEIHGIPALAVLAPILRTDPRVLGFTSMGGNFNAALGTAKTDDFQIKSPTLDLSAQGRLNLVSNEPDFKLTVKLPKGSIGGTIGELANDEEGRPTFLFRLKGDWKPVLDKSQLKKAVVQGATEELKKKAEEVMKDQGKKLLEGIFGR